MQNNYLLIASRFNISKTEAEIVQEKLWNNPSLSISEINLWSNQTSEQFARLFGRYGRTQQFAVELEQVIETAGKRSKRVAIKELERNSALFDYEELMRDLKRELRQTYNTLHVVLEEEKDLLNALSFFERLHLQYKNQSEHQNIAKADWLRVQTELVNLQKEHAELEAEKIELLGTLRVLSHISDLEVEQIDFSIIKDALGKHMPLDTKERALAYNLGIKRQDNLHKIAAKQVELEKSMRKPDLAFQVNYDRGGNIMQDFFGLGVRLDLPVFNRNKGNIQAAHYHEQEQESYKSALEIELEAKITALSAQLNRYRQALSLWTDDHAREQEMMLDNYHKHLQNRQVTLLEFIDFVQAWRESNQSVLEIRKNYLNTYEELQYVVGTDF